MYNRQFNNVIIILFYIMKTYWCIGKTNFRCTANYSYKGKYFESFKVTDDLK